MLAAIGRANSEDRGDLLGSVVVAFDPRADGERGATLECLRECLRESLAPDQKSLLLRYHEDKQRIRSRKGLCDELGIPMNALRIRVHRLRKKVEACIEEKLRSWS